VLHPHVTHDQAEAMDPAGCHLFPVEP